jgi:hypothetical protein
MKTHYQPSDSDFAINGVIAIAMSDEIRAQLEGKADFLDENSKEVQAYLVAAKQRDAEAAKVKSVTMRQARLALLGAGLLNQVNDALAKLESPLKEAATIEWEYSSEVKRNGALVQQLGGALGLDAAALDNLFSQAAKL